jgi:hypothetical protein
MHSWQDGRMLVQCWPLLSGRACQLITVLSLQTWAVVSLCRGYMDTPWGETRKWLLNDPALHAMSSQQGPPILPPW